jgi:multiple antibiotic resistance protein
MATDLLQLFVLFFVIIDPLTSYSVFCVLTEGIGEDERRRIARVALALAAGVSVGFLLLGESLLHLLNTNLDDFRIAGGIVLSILGIQMALGKSAAGLGFSAGRSSHAIAAIIATPLLTGPATITAVILARHDYGLLPTGIALGAVLALSAALFLSRHLQRFMVPALVQVFSTLLGLVTLAWGVRFVREGLAGFY